MANKRKCKYCDKYVKKFITTPVASFCNYDHAVKHAYANKQKGSDKIHKERKVAFKVNDVDHQHDLTQVVFNKLRRLKEFKWFADMNMEPECISCGKKDMDWCCGHFKTRGSQSNIRYDKRNTYLQCNFRCNRHLSGNIEGNKTTRGFKQGLVDRFGKEEALNIINYCTNATEVRRWTGPELVKMRREFSKQIRQLESNW